MTEAAARRRTFSGDDLARPGRPRLGPRSTRGVRAVRALAVLSTGLLAGAFGYGAVNVAQTFKVVPLDVRLTFHTALMRMYGPVMQTTMAVAMLSCLGLAVLLRRVPRVLAAVASALALTSFLVTRFGNVPINSQIKVWALTSAPADHAAILHRWEVFNDLRTAAAFGAFIPVLVLVDRAASAPVGSTALEDTAG